MKNVYRPVRAEYEDGVLSFLNTNRFRNTSYLTAVWELVKNGNILSKQMKPFLISLPKKHLKSSLSLMFPKKNVTVTLTSTIMTAIMKLLLNRLQSKKNMNTASPNQAVKFHSQMMMMNIQ